MPTSRQSRSSSSSLGDKKYAMLDEKKRRRMISNRNSARRSRMKKQQLVQDLTDEVSRLQSENSGISGKIDKITEDYAAYAGENNVLRTQLMELSERLRSLNDIIKESGFPIDIPRIIDPRLMPWQLPLLLQPTITASSGLMLF